MKANFAAFFKRLRFDYVMLLECGNCFARSHSFLLGIRIMAQWGLYVGLAWHIQYCVLPPCACVQVPSTIYLDKDPNYLSCFYFWGLKRSNHVAGCVFYTFFPILPSNRLVHSSNNWKDSLLSTNILICLFYVIFQSQCEHKIALEPEFIEKKTT